MNRQRLWILLGVALIGVVVILLLFGGKRRFDWRETYRMDSREPYGSYIITELLKEKAGTWGFYPIRDSLSADLPPSAGDSAHANYVFIGGGMFMGEADVNRLLDFVANGNQAFIACNVVPYDLMFYLYYEECDSIWWDGYSIYPDSTVRLNLEHPALAGEQGFTYTYTTRGKVGIYNWHYIDEYYFCGLEEGLVPIGRMNDGEVNFARVPYGKGFFYLHTTPLVFTNLNLLEESGLTYADRVFSHLPDGPVYWDEYSRVSEGIAHSFNNSDMGGRRSLSSKSPLQFILSEPSLAWAWYLLLAMGLLFMIFRARRRQRIIPVMEQNSNTSMEFLTTIGRLYFLQNDHKRLALQKMKLFLVFTRERYHLPGREVDEEFLQKLSARAEVPREWLDRIAVMHRNISSSSFVSENTLIDFQKAMEQFYQHCK